MVHMCKIMISLGGVFSFFLIDFLGCQRGKRTENSSKLKIKIISVKGCISGTVKHISWFLKHLCKISSNVFFSFFQNLIFLVMRRVKGQKMVLWQKFCPWHSISQEPYIMCKMIISPRVFFIFSKFLFSWLL